MTDDTERQPTTPDGSNTTDGADEPITPGDDCPTCGRPVAFVSRIGPQTAYLTPCGCRVPDNGGAER